jgi:hypothetical protein
MDKDISSVSILMMRLKEFVNLGHAKTKTQVSLGRVFRDVVNHEFLFLLDAFLKFLAAKNFKKPTSEINKELRLWTEHRQISLTGGNKLNVLSVDFEKVDYNFDYDEIMDFSKLSDDNDINIVEENEIEGEDF